MNGITPIALTSPLSLFPIIMVLCMFAHASVSNADSSLLRKHVESIVNAEGYRSIEDTAALNRVAGYIMLSLAEAGLKPREQVYEHRESRYKNIIAHINPEKEKHIVIGAHYDVCGIQDGADDNASGVAGILELGRLLQANRESIPYHVELVAFTLEEPPAFGTRFMGSYVHARSLAGSGAEPLLMISLEMIGYFSDKKGSQSYPLGILKWFYPDRGDFIAAVSTLGGRKHIRKLKRFFEKASPMTMETLSGPRWFSGIGRSDHRNYWHFGFTAMMITDTAYNRNFHYHTPEDTIEKLDFMKMAQVISGLAGAVAAGVW